MPQKGDEIIKNGIAFVYTEYGVWVKKADQTSVVDEDGIPVDVEKNVNTEKYELLVNLQGHKCDNNSTKTLLGAGGVFTGSDFQSTKDYGVISIDVASDVDSAVDGLQVQWSSDGATIHNVDKFTIRGNNYKTFTFGPANLYVRVVYTNGAVAQSSFQLNTILRRTYVKPSSHRINDNIVGEDDAELMKAVLAGIDPDGIFNNVRTTRQGNLRMALDEYGDTPSIDAFGRLRISNPYTIFDSKELHDKQPLFWDEDLGGSATSTHNTVNANVELEVTANISDYVIRQTKQRFNYQPGKSFLSFLTCHIPSDTGVTKRLGLFDGTGANYVTPNNGIFFQNDGTLSWNIAKNGVTTESVSQSNWNVDTLDGNGTSGITLDMDAAQILIIDFEWLGVGRVRVGFVIHGLIYYCHYFNHANDASFPTVYMSTPNLPVRYDIQSDGSGSGSLAQICSTVMSEGGIEETGVTRSIDTGSTHLDANTANTTYAVIGIRLKTTYKDVTVLPEHVDMIDETGEPFRWSLQLNPIVSGTFTYADVVNSALQKAIGVTANTVSAEGVVIDSGYIAGGGAGAGSTITRKINTALRMGTTIDGVQDEIVVCVTPLGANADIQASLTVRELL